MRLPVILAVVALLGAGCGGSTTAAAPAGAATGLTPRGPTVSGVPITRVVDGDTVHVDLDGRDTSVRLIGINTPETVKPDSPIECFGPEASDFAKGSLTGRTVTLEFDDSQGRTDKFGRTLAYVWIEQAGGGLDLFNLDAVSGGFAEERQYGAQRFAWQDVFREAMQAAQAARVGMWGACEGS